MNLKDEKKRNHTGKTGIFLMLVCSCCLCGGQFIWKLWGGAFAMLAGFTVYGIGALAMLTAYRYGSLSVLQPINSVSYVISTILGYFVFQEMITAGKIIGILAIMSGVILLAKGETP